MKDIISFNEFLEMTGYKRSYAYKLTHSRALPMYKPGGKQIFFRRQDVENFLLSNRIPSRHEIDSDAATHLTTNKKLAAI